MEFSVKCYTLFDINNTGILNKHQANNSVDPDWLYKRNTQCNFDTILQVISLRSQPDVIAYPKLTTKPCNIFGAAFSKYQEIACWEFEFSIQHSSVFSNDNGEFGLLYADCNEVPMIIVKDNYRELSEYLNITNELKNIQFEET